MRFRYTKRQHLSLLARRLVLLCLATVFFCLETSLASPPTKSIFDTTDQLIIKWKPTASSMHKSMGMQNELEGLKQRTGVDMTSSRKLDPTLEVVKLSSQLSLDDAQALANQLSSDSNVEFVEPDRLLQPFLEPNDWAYFSHQWHYHDKTSEVAAANLPKAWDITTGHSDIVIAVLDTGILPHADLTGRTLPGYDFVNNTFVSNDNDGRDSDPTDPGDWITSSESAGNDSVTGSFFTGCPTKNSTWHGTHVTGTIGATTNGGGGSAGVNWQSKIVPVRVMGKCGGFLSDIIAGMRWAAGLTVTGAPTNNNPAHVINMSLGGAFACSSSPAYQAAINEIVNSGVTIVAAAGNSNADASGYSPASCDNVITVAAANRLGGRAYYSNHGSVIDITAPGGQSPLNPGGIFSTFDSGTTSPINDDIFAFQQGTSMAAPHVAGVVSLMQSAYYNLTNSVLSPTQISDKLLNSTRAFPTSTGNDCNNTMCGTGLLDAELAVLSVSTEPTADAGNNSNVYRGSSGSLDGIESSDDGSVISYQWTQTSGTTVTINNSTSQTANFTAPMTLGPLVFQLTVTDDLGLTNSTTVTHTVISDNNAPTTSSSNGSTNEDIPLNSSLAANDLDNNTLTYSIVNEPTKGVVQITNNNTGAYTYTPNSNTFGNDSFTFKVNDGESDSNISTVSITVNSINDPPSADSKNLLTDEDTALNGTLTGEDAENSPLTYQVSSYPTLGSLDINSNTGAFTYQPDANISGADSFTYRTNDGVLNSSIATISITITAQNDPPQSNNINIATDEDNGIASTLSASDIENDTLTYFIVSQPSLGSVNITNTSQGAFTYAPNSNVSGNDSFTFKVNDGNSDSNIATATITIRSVNDIPSADDKIFQIIEDTPLNSVLTGTDIDSSSLSFNIHTLPSKGIVNLDNTTGNFTYLPHSNATGVDSFTYSSNDGDSNSAPASVTITIAEENDAPQALTTEIVTLEDTSISSSLNAADVDDTNLLFSITSQPNNGAVTLTDQSTGDFIYTPFDNETGADSFTFQVSDNKLLSNIGTVEITINPVNDAPSANNISFNTDEDTAYFGTFSANDVDNDPLIYSIVSQPNKGSINFDNAPAGSFVYIPNQDQIGSDTFTYSVTDLQGQTAIATATVEITSINDAPKFLSQGVNGLITTTGQTSVIPLVLFDPDEGDQHVISITDLSVGTASFNDDTLTIKALLAGSDTLVVSVTDSIGLVGSISLPITVLEIVSDDSNKDGIADDQASSLGLNTTDSNGDSDGDSVVDTFELGDPNNPADTDGDNIIDALEVGSSANDEKTLAFIINPQIAEQLSLDQIANKHISLHTEQNLRLYAHNNSNTGIPLHTMDSLSQSDRGFEYPIGIYDFSVYTNTSTATVIITLPNDITFEDDITLRKQSVSTTWHDYTDFVYNQNDNTITLTLTDNDQFDMDPTIGVIRDPVGIALAKPPSIETSNSGGGSSASGGGGGGGGQISLLLLLSLLGLVVIRKQNKANIKILRSRT